MGNGNLQKAQTELLARLNGLPDLKSFAFYLAGGTGLNLYLGHRHSFDEDFFTDKTFDPSDLLKILADNFKVKEPQVNKETLHCFLDGVRCSFFYYPYPLVSPSTPLPFPTASLLDIATMKLAAIVGRGAKKDFYDLFCILQRDLSFTVVWRAYVQKFTPHSDDLYHVAKSLTYFDDAETEVLGIDDEANTWKSVTEHFRVLARELLDEHLKSG